jgi:7,8-dihydro-6-hydroxymethylpterin-pyrophosphokinase
LGRFYDLPLRRVSNVATSREELEEYRERVFQELKARTVRLQEIDTAIASNRYLLERAGPSNGLRSGNTVRILAGASHKARLLREHERLERQRREASADLKRAEERLVDVDQELEDLEAALAGGGVSAEGTKEGD